MNRRARRLCDFLKSPLTKSPSELNEFEERILAGIHYYRRGNYAFDPRDKIINYTVSLESMLVMSGEHPSTTLPKRLLDVNRISETSRSNLRKLIEAAYQYRGEILHRGLSDTIKSENFSRDMQELDRRTLGVILNYLGKPGCHTLKQVLEINEKETVAERERILKSALLEINKDFIGKGTLKSAGTTFGDVEFTLAYRDDGRYIYILGSITKFKLHGTLTPATDCCIDGSIAGITGEFRLEMSNQFDPFDLMQLLFGTVKTLPFQANAMTRN